MFYYKEMKLEIPESVYEPAEDSLLMAKELESADLQGKRVLEVGCGSGLLSIIAAKKGADVTAVDINPEAVAIAKTNAETSGVRIQAFQSDLFSNVKGQFDLIIFNPPYMPVEAGETDARYAGGPGGRDTIEKFVNQAMDHLKKDGIILLLISSLTGEKEVMELFRENGLKAQVIAREKIPWEELMLLEARR